MWKKNTGNTTTAAKAPATPASTVKKTSSLDDDDDFNIQSFSQFRSSKASASDTSASVTTKDSGDSLIDTEIRNVQQSSVESTRRALAQIKETEVVGTKTATQLHGQTEQLERASADMERADDNMEASYKSAKQLHKYDGLIPISFKNMFGGAKKKEVDDKFEARQEEIRKKEAKNAKQIAANKAAMEKPKTTSGAPGAARSAAYDDPEDEINENLDEIHNVTLNLKSVALDMQNELAVQDTMIDSLGNRADHVQGKIERTEKKIQKWA